MSLQGRGPEVWGCRGEQMMGLILDTWNTRYIFFKHGGLFESNSHRVKHFSYDVRSNEFRSQFTCGQLERDVLGGQPNLLTPNIKWGLRTVTVCLRLVPLASLDKGLSGEPPYPEASLNERMRGWNNGWTPLAHPWGGPISNCFYLARVHPNAFQLQNKPQERNWSCVKLALLQLGE